MRKDLSPPSARVEELLKAERALVTQPQASRVRLLQRAKATLRQPLAREPRLARYRTLLSGAAAALTVIAFGAAVDQSWRRWHPSQPSAVAPAPTATPGATSVGEESAPLDPPARPPMEPTGIEPAAATATARTAGARPSRTTREDDVVDEVRLLERARQSLARREFSSALTALANHERRFPAGRLAEEREALKVTAWLGLGRRDEAQRVADEFRKRFAHSVLLPRMDALVNSP